MPPIQFTGFIGPSYTLSSVNADCQRAVNFYPEVNELGTGKNHEVARLVPAPGLKKITTAGIGPNRAFKVASNGRIFLVSGLELYELSGDTPVLRGTVSSAQGPASLSDNGQQLVVVSDGSGYVLTFADNSFAQITDENFPNADTVDFLDQYIFVNDRDTGNFQFSALADATDWDGLDLATPEGSPDKLVTLCVDHREVILFSTQSTEYWFDDGVSPFSRREGSFLERGIAGNRLFQKFDNGVGFWGRDKDGGVSAYRIVGYNAQIVSTNAIDKSVEGYGDLSQGSCWSYKAGKQTFWVTNFPGANTTWVLNVANGLWHERQEIDGTRFRAEGHVFDGTRHLVGDYRNGNIYEMSDEYQDYDGDEIPRFRTCPHISAQINRIRHNAFLLDVETGNAPVGSEAKVMLRWSDDHGHTWKGERWVSLGKHGEYRKLVNWLKLGMSRDRVYEVRITDNCSPTLLGAFLELEGEAN